MLGRYFQSEAFRTEGRQYWTLALGAVFANTALVRAAPGWAWGADGGATTAKFLAAAALSLALIVMLDLARARRDGATPAGIRRGGLETWPLRLTHAAAGVLAPLMIAVNFWIAGSLIPAPSPWTPVIVLAAAPVYALILARRGGAGGEVGHSEG